MSSATKSTCWTVGVSFEEWQKSLRSKDVAHFMDRNKKENIGKHNEYYCETACGLPTRLKGSDKSDLSLKTAGSYEITVNCENCMEAHRTKRVIIR